MSEFQMLGEIIYPCSKCRIDLNHRITLMKGDKPARVLCLTCYTERAYRDPDAPAKKGAAPRVLRPQEMIKVRQKHEESEWKLKLSDTGKTPQTYSPSGQYAKDDHIHHPTFGLGLVVGFVDGEKVQVYFESEGLKLLKGKAPAPATPPPERGALVWR